MSDSEEPNPTELPCKYCGYEHYNITMLHNIGRYTLSVVECPNCRQHLIPVRMEYGYTQDDLYSACLKAWNAENTSETSTSRADEAINHRITLTALALRDALELANPDGPDDVDQLETEVTIMQMSARISVDGGPMSAGLYAYLTDYPEEGVIGPLGVHDFSESSENSEADSAESDRK